MANLCKVAKDNQIKSISVVKHPESCTTFECHEASKSLQILIDGFNGPVGEVSNNCVQIVSEGKWTTELYHQDSADGLKDVKIITSLDCLPSTKTETDCKMSGTEADLEQENQDIRPFDVLSSFCGADTALDYNMYVNPKQYHRILKRREARAKLIAQGKISTERQKMSATMPRKQMWCPANPGLCSGETS